MIIITSLKYGFNRPNCNQSGTVVMIFGVYLNREKAKQNAVKLTANIFRIWFYRLYVKHKPL